MLLRKFLFIFLISIPLSADIMVLESADKVEYYKEGGKPVISAIGNVKIRYKNSEVSADEIVSFQDSNDVVATGHVVHKEYDESDPSKVVITTFADSFAYNLETKLGVILNAQIFTQTSYISGREIRKIGKDTFEAKNASYTTCKSCLLENKSPEWNFRAVHLVATKENYARMSHATFHILDIPVFYFPWFIYPTKTKRQTGFLPPDFLSTIDNNEASMGLGTTFFWAISESYDSTYYFSIVPKRGHKHGLEFRYFPVQNTKGEFNFFYINDGSEEYAKLNRNSNNKRWATSLNHIQDFTNNARFRARGVFISDRHYLSDFEGDVPDYGWKALVSSAVFVLNSENLMASIENSYYYHKSALDQKDSVHKLPEVNFFSTTSPFFEGYPLYYNFDATYTNFYKGRNRLRNINDPLELGLSDDFGNDQIANSADKDGSEGNGLVDSGESKMGHRLVLTPELYLPVKIFNYFKLEPKISNITMVYRPEVESKTTRETPYRNSWNLGVDLSTSIAKIFSVKNNNYKHQIFPEVRYIYEFGEKKVGLHPYFDSFDEMGKSHKVAFILDNLIIAEKELQELFQLIFEQKVNIEYWFRRTTAENEQEEQEAVEKAEIGQVLDPLRVVSKFNFQKLPTFLSSVTGRAEFYYDHYANRVNRISSRLNLGDKRGDSITLGYTLEKINDVSKENKNYLISSLNLFLNSNYSVTYANEYSFLSKDSKRFKEIFGLNILPDSKCWRLNLKYQTIAGGEKEITFNWSVEPNWGII